MKTILIIALILMGFGLQAQSSELGIDAEALALMLGGGGILLYIIYAFILIVLPIVIWYYLGLISKRLRHIRELLSDLKTINIGNKR